MTTTPTAPADASPIPAAARPAIPVLSWGPDPADEPDAETFAHRVVPRRPRQAPQTTRPTATRISEDETND